MLIIHQIIVSIIIMRVYRHYRELAQVLKDPIQYKQGIKNKKNMATEMFILSTFSRGSTLDERALISL